MSPAIILVRMQFRDYLGSYVRQADIASDPEKKRYFKIEGSHTAPTESAWSADTVKKRKLEDQKTEVVLRRLNLNKPRIKRSKVLAGPLTGGFLAREYGSLQDDIVPSIIAAGIVGKGGIPFIDARWSASQNMTSMCIVGEEPWTNLAFGYFCKSLNLLGARRLRI